jgi:sugar lactone lactonase YvrE
METGCAQALIKTRYMLGEGPCYDARSGTLSWVDIKTGTLYRKRADEAVSQLQTGQYLGAAIPTVRGKYIALMTTGIYLVGETALERRVAIPEGLTIHQRFNDAKCDPAGRLFAGTMPLFGQYMQQGGTLYRMDGHGAIDAIPGALTLPNGLAWTKDGRTMYHIDTVPGIVYAMDYDVNDGSASNRRPAFQVEDGKPDGMAIDEEDMLWIAIWGGGEVRRYDPKTGEVVEKVKVPARDVTSCCFGAKDMRTLFITTSGEGEMSNPQAGYVFSYQTKVPGAALSLFDDRMLSGG